MEAIANLISDAGFAWSGEFTDMRGFDIVLSNGSALDDNALYDDDSVELQADRLAETVAVVLESMDIECDASLRRATPTHRLDAAVAD